MKQGVLTSSRVRLLLREGHTCYRQRKRGEMKRKSVRGCIVSSDLSVLNLVVVKKGANEIEGLTDISKPRRLGPKRASKIRKLFNLEKKDDVRKYVIRRTISKDGAKKPITKAPKIQRLVTPIRLQRKRHHVAVKRERYESTRRAASEFNELLAKRAKESREARYSAAAKRRSESRKESVKAPETKSTPVAKAASAPAKATPVAAAKPVVAAKPVAAAKPVVAAKPAAAAAAAKPVVAASKSPVVTSAKTETKPKKK